ncbi:nuclear transport factor 2 family protein [Pseudescherichia sp.]|uniref:nuclear transport factor 2 family protein n=1 Tax=Pseudescherichia sp. TaxID=2055881 RepID=UPI00289AB4B6|nr:nuclear transport factor 2 family protein [Pseudescherichia sp.]
MKMTIHFGLVLAALLMLPVAHSRETKTMTTSAQDITIAQRLIDHHFAIWNDRNPASRIEEFAQVYTPDFFAADEDGVTTGYASVVKMIEKVQAGHPGFTFTPDPISWNYGIGRVTWGYGPKENPNLVRGEDIFTLQDGKISSARVFIDNKLGH